MAFSSMNEEGTGMLLSRLVYLPLFFFILKGTTFLKGLDPWVVPSSNLRYNQACFLTAHNAYANYQEGWELYRQQKWSIKEQLSNGVRGIMLDTHHYGGNIVFCHRQCSGVHSFMRGITTGLLSAIKSPQHQKLRDTIMLIKQWLDENRNEIITIFFENWTTQSKLNQALLAYPQFASLVLSNKVWDPLDHGGEWPTIKWMQKNNKRIVIFVEDKIGTSYSKEFLFRPLWDYVIEANPFSEWYPLKDHFEPTACRECASSARCENKNRSLYMLDFYGFVTSIATSQNRLLNSYETLKKVTRSCNVAKVAHGKMPNFIALDFVDVGNAMKLINELNEVANKGDGQ